MTNSLVLRKESSENDIRAYFKRILEISQTKEEFPVNLDDVWMLVYSAKEKAVRALKENFIQDVDYQVLAQNGENLLGGRPTNVYMLSVSCLEYFIARKVRPVFEVYRQVFHHVVQNPTQISRKDLALMVVQAEEEKERLQLENTRIKSENQQQKATIDLQEEEIKKAAPKVEYYDKTLQSVNTLTTTQIAKSLGMQAHTLNTKLRDCGVQFRQSGMWMLCSAFAGLGLTCMRTSTFTHNDNTTGTRSYTVWTELGRRFICALIDCGYNVKEALKTIK